MMNGLKPFYDLSFVRNITNEQCDQMPILSFYYLATCSDENLVNSLTDLKVDSQHCPMLNKGIENCQILFKYGQSGEFSPKLVTLLTSDGISPEQLIHCEFCQADYGKGKSFYEPVWFAT